VRHAAALRCGAGRDRSPTPWKTLPISSSACPKTLQKVAEGDFHVRELDWLALQHLKKHGLAEDRPAGVGITKRAGACFGAS
jgi:hypothetical protein